MTAKRNYARETLEFAKKKSKALAEARKPDTTEAWQILKDAQKNLHKANDEGKYQTVDRITHWMGGGFAILAAITGEKASDLRDRLVAEAGGDVDSVSIAADGTLTNGKLTLYPAKRERPAPPPGAPRPIYPEDLTREERIEYGMTLPGDIPEEDEGESEVAEPSDEVTE